MHHLGDLLAAIGAERGERTIGVGRERVIHRELQIGPDGRIGEPDKAVLRKRGGLAFDAGTHERLGIGVMLGLPAMRQLMDERLVARAGAKVHHLHEVGREKTRGKHGGERTVLGPGDRAHEDVVVVEAVAVDGPRRRLLGAAGKLGEPGDRGWCARSDERRAGPNKGRPGRGERGFRRRVPARTA